MTDPLAALRQLVAGMTPGEWYESPDGPGASVRAPRTEPIHDTTYVTVANLNDQSLGDTLPDEANAAAIVAGSRALRLLADEATVAQMAVAGINEWYAFTNDNMGVQERWEIAMRAVIAHLAAQIVKEPQS